MSTNIAIIDLGSVRTKLFVGNLLDQKEVVPVIVSKAETGLLSKIQPNGEILPEDISTFIGVVGDLLAGAKAHGVTSVILVATEALRKTTSQAAIVERLKSELGLETNLLTPALEADILYAGIEAISSQKVAVVDVGGGSVQLAWGAGKSVSIPTGTLALQKQFQTPEKLPDAEVYAAMREHVSAELERTLAGKTVNAPTLVVGSTCMRNFFDSAMRFAGIVTQTKESYSSEEVDRLFESMAGKPYESLGEYFPMDLKFLYGADKLLLNLQVLLKRVHATSIIPTNESLSTSLVRLASAESGLGGIGIKASKVGS